ncbi:recombinase family protein [Proteiniborus sp. MB09-C3]|uniref:recombinase family protein n=1 Tax=Proteiniborus sp. MB09-C3 TaxID=3050072 RepID=UPI0025562FAD|nr:recombinase family protein [Proteiniborus sp. MB09-C3]WIV10558.1 recombinase family protein [Proteiniborus sp. MB09-C3]
MNIFDIDKIFESDITNITIAKYRKLLKNKKRPYVWGYARLSRDDDKEQNSLTNQKGIIKDYAESNKYDLVDIMEDDNVSGMTFDRDGISLLKDLIDEGLVDIILVKDLSRLGRHKAYSALFIEYINQKGIKVISINENIDTSNENDDLIIGFKQIINEQYAKDISKKIRSGIKQKQKEKGLVMIPPFAYYKDKNTGEMKVIPECADIVKLIFKLYIDGLGARKIASYLTENGYKTPSQYQKELLGKKVPVNKTKIAGAVWNDRTITRILDSDCYIGTLRCGVSYKNTITKVRKRLSEDEHIIHENFFPPIIDKETWELSRAIKENRSRNNVRASTNRKIHRYAGLLRCGDCNATFTAKRRAIKTNEYIEYVCNTYHRHSKSNYCTSHRIKESEIDDIVYAYLERVKVLAEENLLKVDEFIKEWNNKKRDYSNDIDKLKIEIMTLKDDVKQYAQQLARKLINEELFIELTQESNQKIDLLEKQIQTLEEMIEINKDAKKGIESSVELLTKIVEKKELSNAHLQMLINNIKIFEDEEGKLSLDITLNTPFKYHTSLGNYFTDKKSS